MTSVIGDIVSRRLACSLVRPARRIPCLAEDVVHGFEQRPRTLPPKYFYDAYGAELFDQICDTPEYYPTRAESALLAQYAADIIDKTRPDHIIELGAGTARKTRYLLDACGDLGASIHYWPFDVCEPMLLRMGEDLTDEYAWLQVTALVGDYSAGLRYLPVPAGRKLFVFLGGTIGNFDESAAIGFLAELRSHMGPGDALLLGADRVKDVQTLEAAYDDAAGITARFNLNVLSVINRELEADFNLEAFRHQAVFAQDRSQIEMYLVARRGQDVRIDQLNRNYHFVEGEAILTEISRKFTSSTLRRVLSTAGLRIRDHYEGGDYLYSLVLVEFGSG